MALGLAGCLALSVTACGGSGDTSSAAASEGTTAADSSAATDTEAASGEADKAAGDSAKGLTPEERAKEYFKKQGWTDEQIYCLVFEETEAECNLD